MSAVDSVSDRLASNFLKSLDPARVGAALSKLVAASIGDFVVVLSRSPAHKHFSLADIEWMVLPAVSRGQFYIVEAMDNAHGFRAPIAAVTWAFVPEEVDEWIRKEMAPVRRLRPDQWKNGTNAWLIDAVGDAVGLRTAMQWLAEGPFNDRPLNIIVRGADNASRVTTLSTLMAERTEAEDRAASL